MKTVKIALALLSMTLLAALPVVAQDADKAAWKKSLDFNLAVTQNAYSDSWAGGEAGNASWVSNLNTLFEGPFSPTLFSKTTVKLSFGQTHVQDQETKKWQKPTKSTDLIDIESIASYKSGWFVNPFFGLRFESQFLDASVDTVKRFFNPITLTESAGITRRMYEKEKDFIDSRLGFALKQNINRRVFYDTTDVVEMTIEAFIETETSTDGGLESVSDVSIKIHQNIHWTSKLSLFKAVTVSNKDVDHWSSLDVNWENILAASVTKYITVNLYVQWLYDKQINARGRFKETLALGFTYKLM